MIKPQTLKGFRDFLPLQARKRQYVIDTLKSVFTSYGFEPLETPVLEYEEILTGKYGDEGEKLMYRFEDHGKRRVAMRYDQTVPLARVIAQYQNTIVLPFKRYQIQPVWRAENTQKGRFREFIMCDADTVGTSELLSDAEVLGVVSDALKKLGFSNFKILINDRRVFEGLSIKAITILDKLKKIGIDGVVEELVANSIVKNTEDAKALLQSITEKKPTVYIEEIFSALEKSGVTKSQIEFSSTLARGLDYYTGLIFEVEIPEYPTGSVCGGGRYDNLIGMFAGKQIPAVGFAFGFDRVIEAMETLQLFPDELAQSNTKVLVTIFSEDLKQKSLEASSLLRSNNINTEIYLGEIKEKNPLEKQLKYADAKGIPYAVIIGPEEREKQKIILKDLKQRTQESMATEEAINILKD